MAVVLDHMIVPTRDKEDSARFFARIFGVPYEGAAGHFAPVRVNEQLTLDFDNWDKFEQHSGAAEGPSARTKFTGPAPKIGAILGLSWFVCCLGAYVVSVPCCDAPM